MIETDRDAPPSQKVHFRLMSETSRQMPMNQTAAMATLARTELRLRAPPNPRSASVLKNLACDPADAER